MVDAMISIMSTGSACVAKAGSACDEGFAEHWTEAGLQAESIVACVSREDWADNYSTLSSGVRFILSDTVSALVANQAITFCMPAFESRIVAEDMININRDTALRNLAILRDKKVVDFISGASI